MAAVHLADRPDRMRGREQAPGRGPGGVSGGGSGGRAPRKSAGIAISPGNARAWRTPATMAGVGVGHSESPPRTSWPEPEACVNDGKGVAGQALPLCPGAPAPLPPILSLPPEALAHVLGMLEPLEVVSASCAHPDWLAVANRLVLAPRGHLIVRLGNGLGDGRQDDDTGVDASSRLQPAVRTLHLVAATPTALHGTAVRRALLALARTLPLDAVHTVWLHEDDVPDEGSHTEASQRAALHAILDLCTRTSSVNFSNVRQSASFVQLLADAPRPRFRTRFVFTERNHHASSVLAALDDLGAFFEESVVTVWRPQLSVTAFYPHYWDPACALELPYPSEVRRLCLYGSGLEAAAYAAVGAMAALQDLRLCDADALGDDALLGLATRVRRLRRLAVHDAPGVSSEGWAAALRGPSLRHLESLEVGGCVQLDDDALSALQSGDALEELTAVALDLEGCAKASGAAVDAIAAACPNVEALTLVVAFSPSLVEALARAPPLLTRLKRLTVRVQGSAWPGDPKEAIAGVDRLKRRLRAVCPTAVQMDVSLTFVKLGMAVSNTSDHDEH